jgi:hypothetical protein
MTTGAGWIVAMLFHPVAKRSGLTVVSRILQ